MGRKRGRLLPIIFYSLEAGTMKNYWWYVTALLRDDAAREQGEEILYSAAEMSGSIGAEVQELPDGVRMRIYYQPNEDIAFWRRRLLDALDQWDGVKIEDIGKIENQQWSRQSEEAFPPLEVGGRLVVMAPWHKGKEPEDRIPVYINPGSAFGTGYHESTQAALELFENLIAAGRKIDSVMDVGTGSGILSIAALKLGAKSARSRDIDPTAIEEVRGNLVLNEIAPGGASVETGDLLADARGPFDVMFANILLDPLLEMLPHVKDALAPGGVAIFSGMTAKEREVFLDALANAGLKVLEEITKEDWWGVAAENPA
jgi:ribosomal protein L11 methyltransferase